MLEKMIFEESQEWPNEEIDYMAWDKTKEMVKTFERWWVILKEIKNIKKNPTQKSNPKLKWLSWNKTRRSPWELSKSQFSTTWTFWREQFSLYKYCNRSWNIRRKRKIKLEEEVVLMPHNRILLQDHKKHKYMMNFPNSPIQVNVFSKYSGPKHVSFEEQLNLVQRNGK